MTSELRRAFDPVADALNALEVPYRIGGSVASAALGVARSTLDVDIVADIPPGAADSLATSLAPEFYVDADDIREAIARGRAFNVIHLATMVKVDVFPLGDRPYDHAAFARKVVSSIAGDDDREFPLSTPEDVVLRKLEWYEKTDRTSERQWRDVIGVLQVQGPVLDLEYMRRWAEELGVADSLALALRSALG